MNYEFCEYLPNWIVIMYMYDVANLFTKDSDTKMEYNIEELLKNVKESKKKIVLKKVNELMNYIVTEKQTHLIEIQEIISILCKIIDKGLDEKKYSPENFIEYIENKNHVKKTIINYFKK